MNIQSNENILLTGAGFTKNFGGLLTSEMWAEIFNHEKIQAQPKIKRLMLDDNDFDYESIYYSIIDQPFSDEEFSDDERGAIKDAVKFAYEYIDSILIDIIKDHPYPTELENVTDFIYRFGKTNNKSFIFTLNQDLFFERLYPNSHYAKLSIPGIDNNSEWFKNTFNRPLTPSDYCRLPNEEELNRIKPNILSDGNFFLIKLHGSYNWTSFDGSDAMVIGRGKTKQIQKEPLLKYYFEIFENVLSQNQRRLLIIGYGFGDNHINHIISNAVKDYGLRIYVIRPDKPEDFKKELGEKPGLDITIWKGLSGYFQYSLKEIFSEDTRKNKAIKQHFYDVFWAGLNKI